MVDELHSPCHVISPSAPFMPGTSILVTFGCSPVVVEPEITAGAFIVNPTITNPTYGVYWGINSGSPVHPDVNSYFVITEIYQ